MVRLKREEQALYLSLLPNNSNKDTRRYIQIRKNKVDHEILNFFKLRKELLVIYW